MSYTDEMRADGLSDLSDLIESNGLETIYYRGFSEARGGCTEFSVEPVDAWESYLEYHRRGRLRDLLVFMSHAEARAALEDDSVWQIHQGDSARLALERQLERMDRIRYRS